MINSQKPIGLYLHIPFCKGKCPYCDFYSVAPQKGVTDSYVAALCRKIDEENRIYDTVYFGGGTPSLLGADNVALILSHVRMTDNCEVTLECNPSDTGGENSNFDFVKAAESGVNRISLGLQSAIDTERKALGRRGGCGDVERAIARAKAAGITNISLDLMLGIPNQTKESLLKSVEFCKNSGATHVSAYILKIEEGTFFHKKRESLTLPDEDETSELYLEAVNALENAGFVQYEISNFSKEGFESKHNLKYWRCEEYLGIGAAAHSFADGKRFYYERSIADFIDGKPPVDDGDGGDEEEYIMLTLRLTEGLNFAGFESRFGKKFPEGIIREAKLLENHGLLTVDSKKISLTKQGFLLSNAVICRLLEKLG